MNRNLLLIEDTATLQLIYSTNLRSAGYSVDLASSGAQGIDMFMDNNNPVVVMDLFLPDMDGVDVIRRLVQENPHAKIIVITSNGSVNRAVEAMRAGAFDFLLKPFSDERLFATVASALKSAQRRTEINLSRGNFYGFTGRSKVMQETYRTIMRVAPSRAPVFISGEAGVGKTTCAKAIHDHSGPRSRPFVKYSGLNLGAEAQHATLFGMYDKVESVREAQVDDDAAGDSAFERAFGGTLYLSDVEKLEPFVQSKLATLLNKFSQSDKERDFPRVICSSEVEPYRLLERNEIREDLFYQLHILTINMPALRDLEDDILYIAEQLLKKLATAERKDFEGFSDDVMELFKSHGWPGNLSQLRNLLYTMVATHDGPTVTMNMLPIGFASASNKNFDNIDNKTDDRYFIERSNNAIHQLVGLELDEVERKFIEATINSHGGSIPKAAEVLGVAPSTIYRKRSKS